MSNVSDRPENRLARSTLCQLAWISWRLKIFTRPDCVFRNFKLFVIDISSFFGRLTFRSVRFLQHILNSSPHKNTSNQRMTRFGLNWSIRNWPAAIQMAQTGLKIKAPRCKQFDKIGTKYKIRILASSNNSVSCSVFRIAKFNLSSKLTFKLVCCSDF